jgi:hypothetical protein
LTKTVKIKAFYLTYIYQSIFSFDFLGNTPYYKTKKGSFPIQACPRPNRGKDPLTYLYIKLLFVE